MRVKVRKRTWKELSEALTKERERANKAETLLRLAIVYLDAALEREQEALRPGIRPEHMRRLKAWQKRDEK
jgi:hypothetical protein